MRLTPEQFHRRHLKWRGRFDPRVPESIEDCWWCGRNLYVCRSKRIFETAEEAQDAMDTINFPGRERLVVAYGSCPWREERHWHLATATVNRDKRRARKRMAKKIRLEFEENPVVRTERRVLP